MTDPRGTDSGELAAALAKAQAQFPTINRDKEVRVTSKSGASYTFRYAPLDTILGAVRAPLASNGLALTQLLDGDDLVTMLLHESGATLSARTPLPQTDGTAQALGSAITYLRRYAIQALLGIAAEEDDDGNRASGNQATFGRTARPEASEDGSLIGIAEAGDKITSDFELREDAERGPVIGFRLRGDRGAILVRCFGDLATQLHTFREATVGQRVQVWGRVHNVTIPATARKKEWTYQELAAERVRVPEVGDLPTQPTVPVEAPSVPLFDAAEQTAIDDALRLA